MQKAVSIVPVGWRSKDPVQVVLEADTTFLQLKERIRGALAASSSGPVICNFTQVCHLCSS